MHRMKKVWISLPAVAALLVGCGEKKTPEEPQTTQEMYERVQELLKPNVEHDASDFSQAMEWLHKAAEGGLLQAQTDLGGIYLEGGKAGIKPDGKKAYHWFSQAAEQGSKAALYYMGLILQRGMDMPQDTPKALEYWRMAAEGGVAEAQFALGVALSNDKASEAVQWLIKAAESPIPKLSAQAACALGNLYATGRENVPRDMAESARWYKIAANAGDAASQLVIAIMMLQENNTEQGMYYLRLSAGQDNPQAIGLLINILRNRNGSEQAEQEANAWAERLETLRRKNKPSAAQTEHS